MTDAKLALIFVPGIRPKPPVSMHTAQLRRCLQEGLERAGCSGSRAKQLAAEFQIVGWSRQFYGTEGDISVDLPGIERLLSGNDSIATDRRAAQSWSLRINSILYALSDRFPLLTMLFGTRLMRSRVREIKQYFADENGTGTAAREMVIAAIRSAWGSGQQVLLIAHSFGSVIAWDALWQLSREYADPHRVELFLTMGSPLTMSYIRRRLFGARARDAERYPANIRHWVNVAAIGEATALDRKLGVCFAGMLRAGLVEEIVDDLQLVNQFHGATGLNVHKCYGYLANPQVVRHLIAAIDRAGVK